MGVSPTAGIILAAGSATRMGHQKLLIEVQGRPIIQWVLKAALMSMLDSVVVVLGFEAERVQMAISGELGEFPGRIQVIINSNYEEGMAESIKAGLLAVQMDYPSVMFILGDQPLVSTPLIDALLSRFWSSNKEICAPVFRGRRGHPVVFGRSLYPEILKLRGDVGARSLIGSHHDEFLPLEVEDGDCLFDVDTENDLMRLTTMISKRAPKIKDNQE
jgi:molybdenum cofactor cytidylyltransferase